jgi:hypothetical protein
MAAGSPVPPSSVVIPPTAEPGYQTTEFWGKLAVQVIGLLTLVGVIHLGPDQTQAIVGIVALVGPEAAYAIARGLRKQGTSS